MTKFCDTPAIRMASDERRDQLCQIAMRLFSERGFRGTTTKEIAAAAGVSEAVIFKHFSNKDELYASILDHKACSHMFTNPFGDVVGKMEANDDFGVFHTLALTAIEHHQEDEDFLRLMLHSALEGHDLAKSFMEHFITHIYDFLGAYIKRRQSEGALRELEPRVVVRAFIGMFVHHSLNNILWDREHKLLAISNDEAAREFAGILLNGVRNRNAADV